MWEQKDITLELDRFVNSSAFVDFEIIMDDIARRKFLDIQNSQVKSADELMADRKILNFYMNLARDLKFRLKAVEMEKSAENLKKLEESERIP